MKKYVSFASLRREMECHNRRDAWRLAHNGQAVDRLMSLSMIEESVKLRPDAVFAICHQDDPVEPVFKWRKIAVRPGLKMPSKGHTSFFRVAEPPTPPQKTVAKQNDTQADAGYAELERRLAVCEEHYGSIIESIQRLQQQLSGIQGFNQIKAEMATMRDELREVTEQANRRQYDLSGVRMEVVGAA
ncbi:hypothetical protein [Cerasicoccus maritimus]|uniref:hypothetical protein n=1 Tax=Cerasicoccus maritimus TaxID=490089 RepID=UPI00285265CD|nr:hypothetical protein [Cerasicoccus maritimus]